MLGNELNPESGAAARLQEQLSAELAAHAAGSAGADALVPPPLMNKAGSVSYANKTYCFIVINHCNHSIYCGNNYNYYSNL